MTPHVLVTTVDSRAPGGVAAYWNAVRPILPPPVDYLTVGRRDGERGALRIAGRIASDWRRLRSTIGACRYDLVHLNPSLGAKALARDALSLLLVRRAGIPVLVFFHGWDEPTEASLAGPLGPIFERTFLQADAVIVLARKFERKLRSLGYARPIHVTTTAVPEEAFSVAPREDGGRGVRLLYLSRFEPQKGAVETVRAFALLKRRHPDLTLTLAGTGSDLPRVAETIGRLGVRDVILSGHVSGAAKDRVFSEADIFVFPTTFGEGMPTVVLEAMAKGLPVVTRPVGGVADFFESGRMGYATERSEPEEIALLIERLVAAPEARYAMGAYNREFARRNFHASVVADRLTAIYEETAAAATAGRAGR